MIKIDIEKCNGCGLCIQACHEGALQLVNGKAQLIRDDYCDGLGNCLPVCPMDAIRFEEREALPFDEEAVLAHVKKNKADKQKECGCIGEMPKKLEVIKVVTKHYSGSSALRQWPVQLKLVPSQASFFKDADLLVSADCCAYAYGNFHEEFIKDRVTLIGCPKLDGKDYSQKLTEILEINTIKSITVARMIVPCCTGIEVMVKNALAMSKKDIPLVIKTVSTEGEIV